MRQAHRRIRHSHELPHRPDQRSPMAVANETSLTVVPNSGMTVVGPFTCCYLLKVPASLSRCSVGESLGWERCT